jgi:hypothetical protein
VKLILKIKLELFVANNSICLLFSVRHMHFCLYKGFCHISDGLEGAADQVLYISRQSISRWLEFHQMTRYRTVERKVNTLSE